MHEELYNEMEIFLITLCFIGLVKLMQRNMGLLDWFNLSKKSLINQDLLELYLWTCKKAYDCLPRTLWLRSFK